jgi:cell division protein FtsZ
MAPPRPRTVGQAPAEAPPPAEEPAAPVVPNGPKPTQDEFGFGEVESRGQFERTDRNLFDGSDLDVPTYLRKGIKIAV